MADKDIKLIFQAVDRASASIRRIEQSLSRLDNQTRSASLSNKALTGSISAGFVAAEAAIGAATFVAEKFTDTLSAASEIELNQLGAASGLEVALGSFDNAAGFIDNLNNSLAISAAILPGTTQQYVNLANAISDDVASAFSDANNKITDPKLFDNSLKSLATNYSILGVGSGVTERQTQEFLVKALSGTRSLQQLTTKSIVTSKNARLRTALLDTAAEQGIADLRKLDIKQRVAFFQSVGEKLITPEYLKRITGTYDSTIQGFVSRLFDPNTGVFGLLKDLEPNIAGKQSAFEAIKTVLTTLIGDGGLFDSIGAIFDTLGLSRDPMVELRKGLLSLNDFLTNVTNGLKFINGQLKEGFSITEVLGSIGFNDLGKNIALFINGVFSGIFDGADTTGITRGVVDGLNYIGEQFRGFLITLDPKIYAIALGTALLPGLFAFLGTGIAAAFGAVFSASVINSLALAVFSVFGGAITGAIGTIGAAILAVPASVVASFAILTVAAVAAVGLLAYTIYTRFDEIKKYIVDGFAPIGGIISGIFDIFVGLLTRDTSLINNGISRLFSSIKDAINGFNDTVAIALGGKTSGQLNAAEVERRSYEKLAAAQNFTPRYAGQFPNAANGLFSAVARESRAMPNGARPVIANSSETILTAAQTRNVAGAIGGGGVFAPVINIMGANMDLQQLADKVINQLDEKYRDYQAAFLT